MSNGKAENNGSTIKTVKSRKPKKQKGAARRIVFRVFLSVFTLLIIAAAGLFSVSYIYCKGPSPDKRNEFVRSLSKMSATKWLPRLFFSQEDIDIIVANEIEVTDEVTDASKIKIDPEAIDAPPEKGSEWTNSKDGILVYDEYGDNYHAYVMLVRDPSRVYVGTASNFKSGQPGLRISDALEKEGAAAAINAGGFPDVNGSGDGRTPEGLTVSNGELLWGNTNTYYEGVIGFNSDNVLIVGNMTGKEALDYGIRDCVCFGPVLIVNGEPMGVNGSSLNQRTAIGQRSDGTVIFLCVDGRMPSSLGASYADLISIMLKYGAVNAANLYEGSSTHLYLNGEPVNPPSSFNSPRKMPTFFMVRPKQ